METPNILPNELWHIIALINHNVYYILVCTCKAFKPNVDAMCYFVKSRYREEELTHVWELPNGALHSPDNDTPALVDGKNNRALWYYNGLLHRECDLPAIIIDRGGTFTEKFAKFIMPQKIAYSSSELDNEVPDKDVYYQEYYFKRGLLHRENNLPAIVGNNGTRQYLVNGKYQDRGDEPNAIDNFGRKRWYNKIGQLHRDNDLPAVITSDGSLMWYRYDVEHRDGDLPAVINADGTKIWYFHGTVHRENDLPACIYSDGRKEWYIGGYVYKTEYPNGKCTYDNMPAYL